MIEKWHHQLFFLKTTTHLRLSGVFTSLVVAWLVPFILLSGTDIRAKSTAQQKDCLTTRAAIDIGSGSTKLVVAQVDTCKKMLVKITQQTERPVRYRKDLKENNDELSEKIKKRGLKTLRELVSLANSKPIAAIATEAFRQAKNGKSYLQEIQSSLGLKATIIDQKTEARLGHQAAIAQTKSDPKKVVVWDIGGGSMQFSAFVDDKFQQKGSRWGAINAKAAVLKIKNQKKGSPNPVNNEVSKRAIKRFEQAAKKMLPAIWQTRVKNRQIIGIGGVHYYNTCSHIEAKEKGCTYNLPELQEALQSKLLNKSDEALGGGKYVDVAVANPLLIIGFMKGLGLTQVNTENISIANGVVLDDTFYVNE